MFSFGIFSSGLPYFVLFVAYLYVMMFGQNSKTISELFQEELHETKTEEFIVDEVHFSKLLLQVKFEKQIIEKNDLEPQPKYLPQIEHNSRILILYDCSNYIPFNFNRPPPAASLFQMV